MARRTSANETIRNLEWCYLQLSEVTYNGENGETLDVKGGFVTLKTNLTVDLLQTSANHPHLDHVASTYRVPIRLNHPILQ